MVRVASVVESGKGVWIYNSSRVTAKYANHVLLAMDSGVSRAILGLCFRASTALPYALLLVEEGRPVCSMEGRTARSLLFLAFEAKECVRRLGTWSDKLCTMYRGGSDVAELSSRP